jgi:50S ribosomal protein L16 3-hydroxylase
MSVNLDVLGGISAEQFFAEYWQKKPLLVRNAIPDISDMLEPEDILGLAQQEGVAARLLTQHGQQHEQWKLKRSPLNQKDFSKLSGYWTLLVQAVDHFSADIARLWQHFDFIPQWRRDDIMVSYAPKGGSVGRHFDQYDVFLVQGYGERRWQLGQYCDENTQFIPNQTLRLLPDMAVFFDEVLNPGDLLYVPPKLSHYGVAENDCLTFSFGFRMPNAAQLLDQLTDQLLQDQSIQTPVSDLHPRPLQAAGEVNVQDINWLKQQLIDRIQQGTYFEQALLGILSDSKYPDSLPENEELSIDALRDILAEGGSVQREPAARLLYLTQGDQQQFWALGEVIECAAAQQPLLKQLADGAVLSADDFELSEDNLTLLSQLYTSAILLIDQPDDED